MKLKELNSKWYWRLVKVVYWGILLFFIIWWIWWSIWGVFFENPKYLPNFLKEKENSKLQLEEEYLISFKEKNPKYAYLPDSIILEKAKENRPNLEFTKEKVNLLTAIPSILLSWIIIFLIFYIIHLIIRSITYYIFFWKINPKKLT